MLREALLLALAIGGWIPYARISLNQLDVLRLDPSLAQTRIQGAGRGVAHQPEGIGAAIGGEPPDHDLAVNIDDGHAELMRLRHHILSRLEIARNIELIVLNAVLREKLLCHLAINA